MPISLNQNYFLTVHNSRNYAKQWHWEKIGSDWNHLKQAQVIYTRPPGQPDQSGTFLEQRLKPYISGNCYKKTNQGLSKCLSQCLSYFDFEEKTLNVEISVFGGCAVTKEN